MIDSKYITVPELARYLGIGRTAAYKLTKDPTLPLIRIGQRILVDKQQLDEIWLPNKQETFLR